MACRKTHSLTADDCDSCSAKCPAMDSEDLVAWNLWARSCTQWRCTSFGREGLDYNALISVADILDIDVTPAILFRIQAMEQFVLEKKNRAADDPAR